MRRGDWAPGETGVCLGAGVLPLVPGSDGGWAPGRPESRGPGAHKSKHYLKSSLLAVPPLLSPWPLGGVNSGGFGIQTIPPHSADSEGRPTSQASYLDLAGGLGSLLRSALLFCHLLSVLALSSRPPFSATESSRDTKLLAETTEPGAVTGSVCLVN